MRFRELSLLMYRWRRKKCAKNKPRWSDYITLWSVIIWFQDCLRQNSQDRQQYAPKHSLQVKRQREKIQDGLKQRASVERSTIYCIHILKVSSKKGLETQGTWHLRSLRKVGCIPSKSRFTTLWSGDTQLLTFGTWRRIFKHTKLQHLLILVSAICHGLRLDTIYLPFTGFCKDLSFKYCCFYLKIFFGINNLYLIAFGTTMRSVSSFPPPRLSHCWGTQWTAGSPTTSTWGCRTLSRWTSTSLRLARRWFSKIMSIILLAIMHCRHNQELWEGSMLSLTRWTSFFEESFSVF